MVHIPRRGLRAALGASALAIALAGPLTADTIFTPTSDGFIGSVNASAAERGRPVHAGSKAVISGQRLVPGQELTLMRGTTVLNPGGPVVVDAEGRFSLEVDVDAAAATGLHPIVVIGEKPAASVVVELKISPDLPIAGAEKFAIDSLKLSSGGLYQVGFGAASGGIFVTGTAGRPPEFTSSLFRLDPATLAETAKIAPAEAPPARDGRPGGVYAVYGIGADDVKGTVWVTNTRQNTVAVYAQSNLSLVKQFDPGAVSHARDVVVDGARGRAYASTSVGAEIEVFDTATLEKLDPIVIRSGKRGETFGTMSLDLDPAAGKLFTVSLNTAEAAVVDLDSGEARVFPLPGARTASGVAYDPQEDLLFVASQATDNLLIVKASDGSVLHDVEVGAGALNVTFEPVSRLAFVANRGSGTIAAVDTAGQIVAMLDAGSYPNHLKADGTGNVWAVNKSRGADDDSGDRLWRIAPAK